jgi:hypothetical protein
MNIGVVLQELNFTQFRKEVTTNGSINSVSFNER